MRLEVGGALERLPLYFIENRGQVDSRVAYYVQGRDNSLYFTADGMTLVQRDHGRNLSTDQLAKASLTRGSVETPDPRSRWVAKLDFVGANPYPQIEGRDRTPAAVSYFTGPKEQWKTNLSTYNTIVYADLWPGIDLIYSGTINRLKYSFLVKPGADPTQIRLAYRGVLEVRLNGSGQLEAETPVGVIRDDAPYAYQEVEGGRQEIAAAYRLGEAQPGDVHGYGFALATYDRSKPLVLDPAVLVYAGYIGGNGEDQGFGIAVDIAGAAYVTGRTASAESTFPITVGPDLTYNGSFDAFVVKVNAAGTGLDYASYIGGNSLDYGYAIVVDSSGNAYVAGHTKSAETTFPVTLGPDLTYNGGDDAFVAKVNASGTSLDYAGYIGGSGGEFGHNIAVDASGNAYVTGYTSSDDTTFPVSVGPSFSLDGDTDAFVAKVNAVGTGLDYARYIGGIGHDVGLGIAVDNSGNAYVTGQTSSNQTTFPVTVGPDLTYNGGTTDAFVAKVDATGAVLDYAGYIGGGGNEYGFSVAVDALGYAYVTGYTFSDETTFPVTIGPDLTYNGGTNDAFVAKINGAGTGLDYAGYIGGSGNDEAYDVNVDASGDAFVAGYTSSDETTFPVIVGPDLTYNGGSHDAFIARVNAAGAGLDFAGYVGGGGFDFGRGIAVDSAGSVYVTGLTLSTETSFPVMEGPDLTYNGGFDAFVVKVSESGPPPTLTNTPPATSTATPVPPTTTPTSTPVPATVTPIAPTPTATPVATPGYVFTGFFSPVDNQPIVNTANAGRTIPVKWRITDTNGVGISDPASFVSLTSGSVTCSTGDPQDSIETYSGSSGLQYLGDGNWQFNWGTPASHVGTCRVMSLNLLDGPGTVLGRTASFKFR